MLLRYSGFGIEVYVVVISRNRWTILTPLEKKNNEITINILNHYNNYTNSTKKHLKQYL